MRQRGEPVKILQKYRDGTRTIVLEAGDRVRFPKDTNGGGFLGAKAGECGTVISRVDSDARFQSIAFLDVQTDSARAGGWGTIRVAPWDVEHVPPEGWTRLEAYLSLTAYRTHDIWARMADGETIFAVIPKGKTPGEHDGGYKTIDAALKVKGMR